MSDLNGKPSNDMKKKTGIYVAVLLLATVAAIVAGVVIYGVPAIRTVNQKIIKYADGADVENIEAKAGEIREEVADIEAEAGDIGAKVGDIKAKVGDIEAKVGDIEIKIGDGDTESGGTAGSWDLPEGEQVSRVKIEAELINLYLVAGDAFHGEWSNGESTSYVNFDVTDGVLRICEKGKKGFRISLSLEDLGMNLTVPELKLTVPENIKLEDLEIDVDCGNVVVYGIESEKTKIDAACGNIELKKASPGDLEIQADCGNVDLDQAAAENAELQADFGRVEILESSFRTLTVTADCGVIECRRISAERVDLDADCGNIEISGDYGSLKADCDLGNIDVETDRPENEVRLDLDAEVGNVTVNGKKR